MATLYRTIELEPHLICIWEFGGVGGSGFEDRQSNTFENQLYE